MEIEWLILADAAQVVGNKLYLLGGGWDRLSVHGSFPVNQPVGLAISVIVPWNNTNEPHRFEIEVATEDSRSVGKAEGSFEVGRPVGIRPGQEQRIQVAASAMLRLDAPGGYVIVARIDGEERRRVSFTVVPGAGATKR